MLQRGRILGGEAGGFALPSGFREGGFAPSYGRLRVVKALILWENSRTTLNQRVISGGKKMQEIDIERVREFNRAYKQFKQREVELTAERDMNNKEIDRLCKELSEELGIEITRENAREVCEKYVSELNERLGVGEAIFQRINAELSGMQG